ncbi:MAG TPA: hypothetical protein VE619_08550 [Nitrososphaeraceae archaeon]|nr:hypothetical protein [Nitrososphaeraceae archaeon]
MGYQVRNDKSKRLIDKLMTLDIDEGVRIESSVHGKKMFVTKNASGIFVVQLVIKNNSYENNGVRYFDSVMEVLEFVNLTFQRPYSVVEY